MKNIMNIFKKNGFYVMALVLVAGILAVSGIAGYVSGQKERGAENCLLYTSSLQALQSSLMKSSKLSKNATNLHHFITRLT